MNGHTIPPDDIRPGQYLMVTEWLDQPKEEEPEYYEHVFFWGRRSEPKRKEIGMVFRVKSVLLPFLAIETVDGAKQALHDTRMAVHMLLHKRFVKSLFPKAALKTAKVGRQYRAKKDPNFEDAEYGHIYKMIIKNWGRSDD